MAKIKDLRVRIRLNVLSDFLNDKGDLDQRPGREGSQRKTIIDIPLLEIDSEELDDRLTNAILLLTNGDDLSDYGAPKPATEEATLVTTTTATLNGHVDPRSALVATTVRFNYGTTKELGSYANAAESPLSTAANTAVSAALTGLTAGTKYYFRVEASDAHYTTAKAGIVMSFVTDEEE